jgi:hypothetical protein
MWLLWQAEEPEGGGGLTLGVEDTAGLFKFFSACRVYVHPGVGVGVGVGGDGCSSSLL